MKTLKKSAILSFTFLFTLMCFSAVAQGQDEIDKAAKAVEDKVIEWRRQIHQNPELSNREVETSKLVADHLKSLGLEVTTGIGVHGVKGVLKGGKPGKVIALRADMDALPVKELTDYPFTSTKIDEDYPGGAKPVAHACGHDGHTAMLMGAAEVLAGMKDDIAGTVVFLFQGAEEGPPADEDGGAAMMVKEGALENPKPDMAFGIHLSPFPNNVITYTPGHASANSYKLSIKIHGVGVHGSTPWEGKDPMPVGAEIISALGQVYRQVPATDAFTLSIGKVIDEGRFNIIGSNLTLVGTMRVIKDDLMDDIKMRVERISTNIAEAHGQTAEVVWEQFVPAIDNDPEWVKRILPTLQNVVGEENVAQTPPSLGYDDVSEFTNPIGGMFVTLGAQDVEFGGTSGIQPIKGGKGLYFNHSPNWYINEEVLVTGVRVHVNIVFDFLNGKI